MITQGNWIARTGDRAVDVIEERTGFGIVHIGSYAELKDADYPLEDAKDNARLISASLDMYSLLKSIQELAANRMPTHGLLERINGVIAKVEGL